MITPSRPTLLIASEIILPISKSLLAEIEPTCAISSSLLMGFPIFLSSATTVLTALSIPFLTDVGLCPALTILAPSL